MNAPFLQSDRLGRLTTVLGAETLALLELSADEAMNGLSRVELVALAGQDDLDFEALLGTRATAALTSFDHPEAVFDGIVAEVALLGPGDNGWRYRLVLRPWLWLLSLRRKQQIYHQMTVVDILTEVFAPYDADVDDRLSGSFPVLEYTVQYGETDLDFACRMMERFGISYHFAQNDSGHTLVLSDGTEALDAVPGGKRPLRHVDPGHRGDEEHFWCVRPGGRVVTGAVRLTDYNFTTPAAAMEVDRTGDAGHAWGQIEAYDYPGLYPDQGLGKAAARLRTAQAAGQGPRIVAEGDCMTLRAGHQVQIDGAKVPGVGKAVCLSARFQYRAGGYGSSNGDSDGPVYRSTHVLLPEGAPLAPERKTPLPRVHGPQTALVVGAGEIDCDEYGRILVQFHWDLDRRWSMRCRVSQNWAGRGWGGMVVPRTGMEVVVEFLEGDPDKPLVTGCVYNARNTPPMDLPANKSRSVFKTDSHKGEGFNELTFEDKAGEEFIYMHAQKNLDMHVQNSAQRRVEFDDIVTIGNNSELAVAANRTESVDGKLDVTVKGDHAEKSDGKRGLTVGADFAAKAGGDLTLKADGEIVLDASKITLVAGGSAVVIQGGAVNVAPVLNVGSASPAAAAIPAIPAVLKAAAGEGMPFVSHCPAERGKG